MKATAEKIASDLHELPDIEKLRLVEILLSDLDKPDPEMDKIWAEEARKRWTAYKNGQITSVSYQDMMNKYRHS